MLVVTSEIGTRATGFVQGGTHEVELPNQCVSLFVVVKLAFSDQQKKQLAHEIAIYDFLSSKRAIGIPMSLDLFISFDNGPSALLMGVSISPNMRPLLSGTWCVFIPLVPLQYLNMTCREEFPKILKNQGVHLSKPWSGNFSSWSGC